MNINPETDRNIDALEFVTTGATTEQQTTNENGEKVIVRTVDDKSIKYQTRNISSKYFGEYVYYLEEFANLAHDAFNNMYSDVANSLGNQIQRKVKSHGYSMDAKSSEIVQDHNNNQKNLLHMILRNEVHKKFTVEGQQKNNVLAGSKERY